VAWFGLPASEDALEAMLPGLDVPQVELTRYWNKDRYP
jgi:hypothetical protein